MDKDSAFASLSMEELDSKKDGPIQHQPRAEIVSPIPNNVPFRYRHRKLGEPTASWPYRSADGKTLFHVCRWDAHPKKIIRPVVLTRTPSGKLVWLAGSVPVPRPLLNLDRLATSADASVIVTEGEKAAEAAALLFPAFVTTTSPNGAQNASKADWSPLKGRTVVISPDADAEGTAYAQDVRQLCIAAGATDVLLLKPETLGNRIIRNGAVIDREVPTPDKWDLADALNEGWTADLVAGEMQRSGFFSPFEPVVESRDGSESFVSFGSFRSDGIGVIYYPGPVRVCGRWKSLR